MKASYHFSNPDKRPTRPEMPASTGSRPKPVSERRQEDDVERIVKSTLARCRIAGLRRTNALEELIRSLAEAGRPMTIAELASGEGLRGKCDNATICRLLGRLIDRELVRRMGLHIRASYFTLLLPGVPQHYLICRACGTIASIGSASALIKLERRIAQESGFSDLYHELEFYGVCPACR